MSWHPNDLVTDADLRDYENAILDGSQTSWQSKRTKALEDWLFPVLKSRGFDPYRLRTRLDPIAAFSYTASAYVDRSGVLQDTTEDDLNLATVFATPSSDALLIGSAQPFRGLFLRVQDSPSTAAGVMTVKYWNGAWTALQIADGTIGTAGKTLSRGGSVTWIVPVDWSVRAVNGSSRWYWAHVSVSAVPTGCVMGQASVIRASALRAPATFRTLELIFREAPTGSDGPWIEKAAYYKDEADQALSRALPIIGGEFDTDKSDQVSATEDAQTAEEAGGGPWTLERA